TRGGGQRALEDDAARGQRGGGGRRREGRRGRRRRVGLERDDVVDAVLDQALQRGRIARGRSAVVAGLRLELREAAFGRVDTAVELGDGLIDAAAGVGIRDLAGGLGQLVALDQAAGLLADALRLPRQTLALLSGCGRARSEEQRGEGRHGYESGL